jgi:hypothetical protein
VTADVKRLVRSFYAACFRRSPALYDELGILEELSAPVRAALLRDIGSRHATALPFLQASTSPPPPFPLPPTSSSCSVPRHLAAPRDV